MTEEEMVALGIKGEEALAHFGKKGMKWGVRNDKDTSSSVSGKKNSKLSTKSKVSLATLMGVGTTVAAVIINNNTKTRLSSLTDSVNEFTKDANARSARLDQLRQEAIDILDKQREYES